MPEFDDATLTLSGPPYRLRQGEWDWFLMINGRFIPGQVTEA